MFVGLTLAARFGGRRWRLTARRGCRQRRIHQFVHARPTPACLNVMVRKTNEHPWLESGSMLHVLEPTSIGNNPKAFQKDELGSSDQRLIQNSPRTVSGQVPLNTFRRPAKACVTPPELGATLGAITATNHGFPRPAANCHQNTCAQEHLEASGGGLL